MRRRYYSLTNRYSSISGQSGADHVRHSSRFFILCGEDGCSEIGKINVDENRELAKQYRILSIPTVVLFENGEALKRHSGVLMEDELKEWIEE